MSINGWYNYDPISYTTCIFSSIALNQTVISSRLFTSAPSLSYVDISIIVIGY